MNVQESVAKAVLVDQDSLKQAQLAGDVLAAHEVLMDAYNTDVRGLLREWRIDKAIDPEPMKAYAASGYAAKIAVDRIGGNQAGWGA
jgi:L-rhamnose isomerase/sugar isomerase